MTLPVARASGGPWERGLAIGEALSEPINRSVAFLRRFLDRRGVGVDDLPELLAPSRRALAGWRPGLLAEIDGTAEGAGVSRWELFAANTFEELEAALPESATVDRCTAFALTGPDGTIVAHNELWYAADVGNASVVVARPDVGPAFASPTVATYLPAVGMNARGVAQGVMSLTHRDDGEGIPRVPVSRDALQADDFDDHHARVTPPGRSGGYAYVVARAGGEARTIETTASASATLLNAAVHTNHYLAPPLAEGAAVPTGSASRLDRLRELLAGRDPRTPGDAMAILADHAGQTQPICVHPDPDDEESDATVFAMVCHLEERRMWVSPGNPCEVPFEEIDVGEVA